MIFSLLTGRGTPLIALFVTLGLTLPAQARNLYRYQNEEGNVVMGFNVPAQYVAGGYEVVNEDGVVIKVVPRELTEEERQVQDAEKELESQARDEEERLRKWDESLLLRYSTVADIDAARERALRDLRIRVSILKSNKRSLRQQVENYQAQAAEIERSGQEVDVERLSSIENLQKEIASTDRAIYDRQHEIAGVSEAYQADIDRFRLLLEMVELRRSLLAEQHENDRKTADPRR